ncbi:hypothetical protein DTO166G4_1311 [Paecilomyces variotii]|nr:hypothetical protein DTO166G4_1311 [Paecilomyces variotii]KAJ9227345.1 hypothetical protein DTO169C6_566 [Paecilomyces variotii]KAJ9242310.1 hypothetical protein DTO166G5_713 [Paecilomyces variotii]KAJ9258036.1 hypothetical protein DTO207G8_1813 [Paecilomyces variotii]KAJ9262311.1 hypothetical protein DTO195F2_3698 [Paecilomyces variotii]
MPRRDRKSAPRKNQPSAQPTLARRQKAANARHADQRQRRLHQNSPSSHSARSNLTFEASAGHPSILCLALLRHMLARCKPPKTPKIEKETVIEIRLAKEEGTDTVTPNHIAVPGRTGQSDEHGHRHHLVVVPFLTATRLEGAVTLLPIPSLTVDRRRLAILCQEKNANQKRKHPGDPHEGTTLRAPLLLRSVSEAEALRLVPIAITITAITIPVTPPSLGIAAIEAVNREVGGICLTEADHLGSRQFEIEKRDTGHLLPGVTLLTLTRRIAHALGGPGLPLGEITGGSGPLDQVAARTEETRAQGVVVVQLHANLSVPYAYESLRLPTVESAVTES